MLTAVLKSDLPAAISQAVEILRQAGVVALPTETVYGLAGDAFDSTAVARIFEAKDRPRFDPLIVHVADLKMLRQVARGETELVSLLMEKYWPGPLTLILPKQDVIPELVTAGSDLVAVRMPAHPIFQAVLKMFGRPLAAPSANPFGRISPTTAGHVLSGLDGRIPLILDGGKCRHGLESTILYPKDGTLHLLRAGPISAEELAQWASVDERNTLGGDAAPGQLASHYSPGKPLFLVDSPEEIADKSDAGFLGFSKRGEGFAAAEVLSGKGDLVEAAANFFSALHRLDAAPVSTIYAEKIAPMGLGKAIMDRLVRAAVKV